MRQHDSIKNKYPDSILLFRVGDFYETFGEDAKVCSEVLGIVLTKRSNGTAAHIPLSGFPHHALDTYLPKLIAAGKRVAICDQLEEASPQKKVVRRGVTEVISPGLTFHESTQQNKTNNFLCALHTDGKGQFGLSFIDISTGAFLCAKGDENHTYKLLESFSPSEILLSKALKNTLGKKLSQTYYVYYQDEWLFDHDYLYPKLLRHFKTNNLKGFGVEDVELGIICCGIILNYISDTYSDRLKHITKIERIEQTDFVWMDKFTIRNLELTQSLDPKGSSLLHILDQTVTLMGSRLLKMWVLLPLKDSVKIQQRLSIVSYLVSQEETHKNLRNTLKGMTDMDRVGAKLARRKISPREFLALRDTLQAITQTKEVLENTGNKVFQKVIQKINPCTKLLNEINAVIHDPAPVNTAKGNFIRPGYATQLDEYRDLLFDSKGKLEKVRELETKNTDITNLKVGFNQVYGYYFEVTHKHKNKIPEHWTRRQTLTNAERYISPQLKELEDRIFSAQESFSTLELSIFETLIDLSQDFIPALQSNAKIIASLDCLCSFAYLAKKNDYHAPKITKSSQLEILEGRHPVIESHLREKETYIPNDTLLDDQEQQIMMITGPNMSGKSAYLRQCASIVLMAQMGSFVPAQQATIGIVDKVFSRVGASDNISAGESTFMVEMSETATILNNLSAQSLILMDEIGRGTSTYDGISIAWSIAQFLHQHPLRPKTLFATHYHEMAQMSSSFYRIKNFHVSVKSEKENILFLRKLKAGASTHSFGIHVAEMSGIPKEVTAAAKKMLRQLENQEDKKEIPLSKESKPLFECQKATPKNEFITALSPYQELQVDEITPLQALVKLTEIVKLIRKHTP